MATVHVQHRTETAGIEVRPVSVTGDWVAAINMGETVIYLTQDDVDKMHSELSRFVSPQRMV